MKNITEIENKNLPIMKPIQEIMNINVPNINESIPCRNGNIWVLTGSGGSGKTSLLLNFFKSKKLYLKKYHNIFFICPESSYLSVADHPFNDHDKIYHDFSDALLYDIFTTLDEIKKSRIGKKPHYNLVIIDDQADRLKDNGIQIALNKLLIKARHLNCGFIFTLQSYMYFPKILRKQITYITIFKPKNISEFESLASELFNMKKDEALQLFNYVFDEPYNHLDVNTIDNTYYKNFNKFIID
jgi:GTPase SAR1 family protein